MAVNWSNDVDQQLPGSFDASYPTGFWTGKAIPWWLTESKKEVA